MIFSPKLRELSTKTKISQISSPSFSTEFSFPLLNFFQTQKTKIHRPTHPNIFPKSSLQKSPCQNQTIEPREMGINCVTFRETNGKKRYNRAIDAPYVQESAFRWLSGAYRSCIYTGGRRGNHVREILLKARTGWKSIINPRRRFLAIKRSDDVAF